VGIMNLRQLEVFQAIMKTGSVTEAAEILGLSQPAVSVILKNAETQIGMKLFERMRGRLHPTLEARTLAPDVEAIFTLILNLNWHAGALRDGVHGIVGGGSSPSVGHGFSFTCN
jgi:DNA-binding transcriptional LysR family regulator